MAYNYYMFEFANLSSIATFFFLIIKIRKIEDFFTQNLYTILIFVYPFLNFETIQRKYQLLLDFMSFNESPLYISNEVFIQNPEFPLISNNL